MCKVSKKRLFHFITVRFYQESHVPKKTFTKNSIWSEKNLKGSQQNADLYC